MSSTYEAWSSGRPIFSRLPEVYQDNQLSDWLTVYWDEMLASLKSKIDDLPRQLSPLTCDENWLDYLAPLCGFTGEYWDRNWKASSKRLLLNNSYSFIWRNKGTRNVLSFVLNALEIDHIIWEGSKWVLGVSQVSIDILGTSAWEYKILLPNYYQYKGYEWKLAEKINRLYGPLWCGSEVRYREGFVPIYVDPSELIPEISQEDNTYLLYEDGTTIVME
jgi:phage tail P2-like protein